MNRIPFRLVGNLLLIEATINGKTGEFLLDTGAPELIVNQAYFEGVHIPWALSEVVDFHGRATSANHLSVTDFSIGELVIEEKYALSIDMRPLERLKHISLFGIIGYSALRDLEIFFDFDRRELVVTRFDKKKSKGFHQGTLPDETFDLRISGHIPYLVAKIGGKKMRMGIDSGAEVNILHNKSGRRASIDMDGARKLRVSGITDKQQLAVSATVNDMSIDAYSAGPMR